MDNFSPNRRNVVDITDLNKFLTKMYGLMTLAVLLSALTAWLVMTVFAQQFTAFMVNNRWGMWLIILCHKSGRLIFLQFSQTPASFPIKIATQR